jgi:hypothetical protein
MSWVYFNYTKVQARKHIGAEARGEAGARAPPKTF